MVKTRTVQTPRGVVSYLVSGEEKKDTLLFIPGAGADASTFIPQLKFFRDRVRSIALDLPAHGKSVRDPLPAVGDCVDALLAVTGQERVTRCIAIGHSLGGRICLELLRAKPGALLGAVLVSAIHRSQDARIDECLDMLAADYDRFTDVMTRNFCSQNTSKAILALVKRGLLAMDRSVLENDLRMSGRFDYSDLLPVLALPVLTLSCEHDRLVPADQVRELCRSIPGSTLRLYDSDSHLPHVEHGARFNSDLALFAEKVFSR